MYHTTIGHAHLKVRDLDRAVTFYTQFLDLHEVERIGRHYAFLTGGELHHEIALQQVGPNAPAPPDHGTGLYHVAFEVGSKRDFTKAYKALQDADIEVGAVDHRISWAMYFSDPDGNGLEIYWDTRNEPGGTQLWQGINLPLSDTEILSALDSAPAH